MKHWYWTLEEEEKLKRMWKSDLHVREIAKTLDRSVNAVYNKAYLLRLKGKKHVFSQELRPDIWSEAEKELLKQMVRENKSIAETEKALNRSREAITNMTHKLGLRRTMSASAISQAKGRDKLNELKVKILEEGNSASPYDFIIEENEKQVLLNVKVGFIHVITQTNLERLKKLKKPFAFLLIHKKNVFYLKYKPIEM